MAIDINSQSSVVGSIPTAGTNFNQHPKSATVALGRVNGCQIQ